MTTRSKAVGTLVGIFLLGGLCGALVVGLVMRDHVREARNLRDENGFVAYFTRQLELTSQQRDSLRDELTEAFRQLSELRTTTTENYNTVLDSLKRRIYPQLSETQQRRFMEEEQKFRGYMPREDAPRMAARRGGPHAPAPVTTPGAGPAEMPAAAPSHDTGSRRAGEKAPAVTTPAGTPTIAQTTPRSDTSHPAASMPPPQAAVNENEIIGLGEGNTGGLAKTLQLTPEQRGQLAEILRQARTDIRQLAVTYRENDAMLKQMRKARVREAKIQFRNILTPEQRELARQAIRARKPVQ